MIELINALLTQSTTYIVLIGLFIIYFGFVKLKIFGDLNSNSTFKIISIIVIVLFALAIYSVFIQFTQNTGLFKTLLAILCLVVLLAFIYFFIYPLINKHEEITVSDGYKIKEWGDSKRNKLFKEEIFPKLTTDYFFLLWYTFNRKLTSEEIRHSSSHIRMQIEGNFNIDDYPNLRKLINYNVLYIDKINIMSPHYVIKIREPFYDIIKNSIDEINFKEGEKEKLKETMKQCNFIRIVAIANEIE